MLKFIHFTDPHLVEPGALLYGLDPLARMKECVADINARHGDAAFCVVTGDLTHRGQPEAFAGLRDALAALKPACHLLLGNHDARSAFWEAFPQQARDNGFAHRVLPSSEGRIVLLDTVDEGQSWGRLCPERLAWLERQLKDAADEPIFLFMHHPPFGVGIPGMDRIALQNPEEFWDVLAPHRVRIRHLFFGHLHRPVNGSWRGIPHSTLYGTNHQVDLDFTRPTGVGGSHEPPAYGVVLVDRDSVIVHTVNYTGVTARFDM